MRWLRTVLAFILLAAPQHVFALDPSLDINQYAHATWKVREGFSKGAIYSIAQTPDGYLWLGTEFGLLRFDGVTKAPWQPPAGEQLPNNDIQKLLVTRDGRLWIGTVKGLASWKDNELTQYPELAGQSVSALLEDQQGTLWVGGESTSAHGALCAIQIGSVRCDDKSNVLSDGVAGLFEDRTGHLWVGLRSGLWRWKPGPPQFYPMRDEPIGGFAEGDNGALLISTGGGIRRLIDGKVEPYPLPGSIRPFAAYPMLSDRDGGLWIGTLNRGLVHVHHGRVDEFSQSDGLSGDIVSSIFEDKEGNIWVATAEGLDRFRDLAVATFSVKQGLSDPVVCCVLADVDGSVWISTYGGLDRWNNGQISTYGKGDGKFNGHVANSLLQDRRGRIWASTRLGFGNLENGRLVPVRGIPGRFDVHGTAQDTDGNLWIANQDALFRLSPRSEVQQILWGGLGHTGYAWALAADTFRGGVWLGFIHGGIAYLRDGQVRASYATADGLGVGPINHFLFDRDGTTWIASDGGLSRLKNGHAATLTSKNGLPCDAVHWAIEDNDHSFWLYMPCGLIRISRSELDAWGADIDTRKDSGKTIRAIVFDISEGVRPLAHSAFYNPQVAKASDGRLWFLHWDGVSVIDPRHIPFNKLPPPVHIEQIVADSKTYDLASGGNEKVHLPKLIRDVQIDYTALSFVDPAKNLFRYKLEGRDLDWQQVGNRRQAFYTNLPPGNYRFRVIACNNSGVWNETGASLAFSVAPAWFQTDWFRIACVAAFLTLMWGLYQLRLQQLRRQFNVRLEARVNERTRIARELHDTLLQSLHGLMFECQAARNMFYKRPEEALQALDGAIMGTERAITESQDAIENLRSTATPEDDLAQLVKMMGEDLVASRPSDHDSPTFGLTVEGRQRALAPVIRDEVYRIAREVLRNAFRHAQARRIEAEILYDEDQLRLRVRDDGRGMDQQVLEEGRRAGHWGLPGVRERAQQIGAKLDVWSEAGAGTEVQLAVAASIAYQTTTVRSRFRVFQRTKNQ
jgi:signal transduction histidine kinase/ligand-binding sensor domain-containing protein